MPAPHDTADLPADAPLPRVLWPLLFGNFVIGTGVMVVPGTLNDISADLQVSVPVAGQPIPPRPVGGQVRKVMGGGDGLLGCTAGVAWGWG